MDDDALPESAFSRSISEFLPRVDCHRARDETERTQIFRLRHLAYSREGALPPDAPEIFSDAFDEAPNAMLFGFHVAGALASSIRFHVASRECPVLPALTAFGDHVQPLLDRGLKVIDSTRFVIEPNAARLNPRLPYATVRLCAMAGEHFDVDVSLATVRVEHQSFYKRLFGYRQICEARPYPSLAKPISLMAVDFRAVRERVKARYPFLASTVEERRLLFSDARGCGA